MGIIRGRGNNEWLELFVICFKAEFSVGTGKCSSAVPMIVARSRAERGNNEWLEKLQCSSGVPIIVKSVPLRSVGMIVE